MIILAGTKRSMGRQFGILVIFGTARGQGKLRLGIMLMMVT